MTALYIAIIPITRKRILCTDPTFDKFAKLFSHTLQIRFADISSHYNQGIGVIREKASVESEKFPQEPFYPIPPDGASDLFACCDPQSPDMKAVFL